MPAQGSTICAGVEALAVLPRKARVACLDVEDGGPANKVCMCQVWAELFGGGLRPQEPTHWFVPVAATVGVVNAGWFGEKHALVHDVLFFTVLGDGVSA